MIKCLDFFQILPTSEIRDIRRIVRRIWMLILGLEGLSDSGLYSLS